MEIKKGLLIGAMMAVSLATSAGVVVKFPDGKADSVYTVQHRLIADGLKPRAERPQPVEDMYKSVSGVIKFDIADGGASRYVIPLGEREAVWFFAEPGDNLAVIINSMSPLDYDVTGTELMDGITAITKKSEAAMAKYRELAQSSPQNKEELAAAEEAYWNVFKDYMAANQSSPASLYALLQLEGDDFMEGYAAINEQLKTTMLYPMVESAKAYEEKRIADEKKIEALQAGNVEAPNFTLKNLEGKDVSLSDFRGKWVVIDFWGSWCGWCIKGFPKLKDAYEQYSPELEVLGVDCNELEENWRKGVEKYKLPWVNVYNPQGSTVLSDYGVSGFPTKVIVNPEGKIANITIGEEPAFFDTLAKLINGKE